MPSPRIALPCVNTWCGPWEIGRFLTALEPYWDHARNVVLDLSTCQFLSAEGAAMLAAFKLRREAQGRQTELDWDTVNGGVATQLGRWQLNEHFGRHPFPWRGNAVPIFHQTRLEPRALVEYVVRFVQSGQHMPAMTAPLVKEVQRSFCELFQNVFAHSESPFGGLAIGQLYPNVKYVQICVCDGGVGIVHRVHGAGHATQSPGHALAWALQEGTTTRSNPKGPPGGIGLFLLREFAKVNGGSLRVIANDGYLCQEPNGETRECLSADFFGTLIQLKFMIRDDVIYTLSSA